MLHTLLRTFEPFSLSDVLIYRFNPLMFALSVLHTLLCPSCVPVSLSDVSIYRFNPLLFAFSVLHTLLRNFCVHLFSF